MSGSPSQMAQKEAAKRLSEETTCGHTSSMSPDTFPSVQDKNAADLTRANQPGYK